MPPSSSVITNGTMPPGAEASKLFRAAERFAGAEAPNRMIPPAPAAISRAIELTAPSSTGMTTVCSARRRALQVARSTPLGQAAVVDVVEVAGDVVVEVLVLVDVVVLVVVELVVVVLVVVEVVVVLVGAVVLLVVVLVVTGTAAGLPH